MTPPFGLTDEQLFKERAGRPELFLDRSLEFSMNYLAFFFQRVAAAFLAISRRFLADSRFALAKPPLWPSSTAAWFFLSSVCGDSWISPAAIRMT